MWAGVVVAGFSAEQRLSWGFECHSSAEEGRGQGILVGDTILE